MITLRQEEASDHQAVENLIAAAFQEVPISDHQEHFLVARLRRAPTFVPELSIVAVQEEELLGHILLTPIQIAGESTSFPALALAPVSVKPEWQGQGIGGALIREAHQKARDLGHQIIVLVGHESYYPRFGYQLCCDFNIQLPFPAPDENCMVIGLQKEALQGVSGMVVYPAVFFEE